MRVKAFHQDFGEPGVLFRKKIVTLLREPVSLSGPSASRKQLALLDVSQTLKRNERCAPAHYFVGQITKLMGDEKGALKHFKRAVEISPDFTDAQREVRLAQKK